MRTLHYLKPVAGVMVGLGLAMRAVAGIPVIDGSNAMLNEITSGSTYAQMLQQIDEYKTQVKQYTTQLDQYRNMVQNTAKPIGEVWGQVQGTIDRVTEMTDTLSYYKQQAGDLDRYLAKFKDINYYKNSPCFNGGRCSDADREELFESQEIASQSQKQANDAVFKGIEEQQATIKRDSARLQELQSLANDADGQMKALGYANQLASQQANQLMQIRSLMITQQGAIAAQQQAAANKEAMQDAASRRLWTISKPDRSLDKGFTP
ncbi:MULTISPECIES: P-type conjugative transfer protein TrbJ [Pseudomonas]|uniref:P-type conjugative transfer protein TrbJ n=1 Tax=Pseudomonas parafulva TaxID=157782 RepID=A0AAJ0LLQ2_9PSED|nr:MULTISPECIES: P-type conjugative transfer protein TrbJ [Pseudomonas]AQW66793.1 P-type conjugative transfer protein TrbJ [Pseudomonas parafulva]KTT17380.1 hypothetical protein NS96R_12115 [Pseudomonas parafulva]MBF8635085.1 P-type conjugative transfer protein TrbJ [Pseudomonas fulva]MBF8678904.1 P-type conjugative transfer protein TrbJ [Pseudomonas fulva]MBF8687475.1 P-type conjugative transfer protein TrbJ [Pseudomonas fulva]